MAQGRYAVFANSHNNSRKTSTPVFRSTRPLDQLRVQMHYLHYSLSTEDAYAYGVKKFIDVHQKKHSRDIRREQEAALAATA
jgi:hypothetical protein